MRARDFLKENIDKTDIHAIVKKFLPFVQQHLELSDLPEIELLDQPLEGTFGRYGGGQIRVMAHGRHPIDVLRTLAHELVHYKQDSEGRIHDDSGETGSDEENEANAVAGVIMRDFDQAHPELLAALKESRRHDVSKESSTVTAHGYEYNRQDQRIAWTRDFASEAAAKEWARRRNATVLSIVPKTGITEGKITLSTDPDWYGATIDNYKATGPVVDISANQLVGFEPDDKMDQPKSKENVKKIVAGLKKGDKLPPLLVRKYKKGYQVLDGHHRFWAYKSLGVKSIPVQVVPAADIEEKGHNSVTEGNELNIDWVKPNFDFEWHEVEEQSKMKQVPIDVRQYYQKYFPNKDAWLKAVQNGRAVVVQANHNYEIRNAPFDKASLQKVLAPTGHEGPIGPEKEKRVNALFDRSSQIEMPIILKTSEGLWLIGGKTRLGTANYIKGIPAKVWLIGGQQDMSEGAMSDLDLDIQDEHWDGIVGYVINGLKTGISAGRMELYLYKWAGNEMFDLDEELRGRGFDNLYQLVDHIQAHGGKYVNPTFDLDGLFGDDLDEEIVDEWSDTDSGIKQYLVAKGYTFLDDGVDQSAYIEPGTGWVLKIFGTQKSAKFKGKDGKPTFSRDHQMFFKWANYCMDNDSNPFLPRFGGFESFGWKGKTYLQIRQEPLVSAKRYGDLLAEVATWVAEMQGKSTWLKFKKIDAQHDKTAQWTPRLIALMGGEQNSRQFYETLNALYKIGMSQGPGWIWDLHRGNFMMRGKTPVIVDPWVLHKSSLWFKEGATASDDHDYDDDEGGIPLSQESLQGYTPQEQWIIRDDEFTAMDQIGYPSQSMGPVVKPIPEVAHLFKAWWSSSDADDMARIKKIKQLLQSGAKQLPVWIMVDDFDTLANPRLLEGFHRFAAAIELKLPTIPVCYITVLDRTGLDLSENFKDGRHPEDKGDAKRHGINTRASVSSLRKTAKSGGRKGQLAHWLANMKAGRAKNHKS